MFACNFFRIYTSKSAHALHSSKKEQSCRRDEKNDGLWSMGQRLIIYFADVLCNLSSRQNNHTLVAALGKGYHEAHKSWKGLKAMSIHLLNFIKAVLESQRLDHRVHGIFVQAKSPRVFKASLNYH